MVGEIVVVFHRLESGRLTEETEVVYGYRFWEKHLYSFKHPKAGAEDGDYGDIGGSGFCCVGVVERCLSLYDAHVRCFATKGLREIEKCVIRGSLYRLGNSLGMLLRLHSQL